MKNKIYSFNLTLLSVAFALAPLNIRADSFMPAHVSPQTNQPIPWQQIGAQVSMDYHGDGLAVKTTEKGASLHCVFQRLDADATREGLWLGSTVGGDANDKCRVRAARVGRRGLAGGAQLPMLGDVELDGRLVRYRRPGLVEEYTVSADGVRQDFVVLENPAAAEGDLLVKLEITGARVEQARDDGAQLVLFQSERKIAYGRMRVTDATGRQLPARMEVANSGNESSPSALMLSVSDAAAVYPVRIDPTFSDANWISIGGYPGTDNTVSAILFDGSGNLYIGGAFNVAANITAKRIVKWDGTNWSTLGLGMDSGVLALALLGNDLYAAGQFTIATNSNGSAVTANRIAKWNGSSWSALGLGMNDYVNTLAILGNNLYAGGIFTTVTNNGGASFTANHIAKWNGSTWSPLGSGMNNDVTALAVSGNDLYAAGRFTTAGVSLANRIAKWDGSSWDTLNSGMNDDVSALAVSGTDLYAGGRFTTAGGTPVNYIAKWNGSSWSTLSSGLDSWVFALAASGTNLYVGGWFAWATNSGGLAVAANEIAKWDGTKWSALSSGIDANLLGGGSGISALAVSDTNLYVGGYFQTAGSTPARCIAKWNGANWSSLAPGMNGAVRALAVSGSDLYLGGYFTTVGGIAANYVAKWDGTNWSSLGFGLSSKVNALAISASGDLYAGGNFTADSMDYLIAKWDGVSWSPLNSDLSGSGVYALAISGTDLYVGGNFTGFFTGATNIAKWNGSSWSALGAGLYDSNNYSAITSLAVSGTDLYAGGGFTTAGGIPATNIARWNGTTWSALGSGLNFAATALVVSGGNLYAGGTGANGIAKWDGSSWSPIGLGINGSGSALALSGGDLYVAGDFTIATNTDGSTVAANRIAKWNGSSWSALGSGLNYLAVALVLSGNDLYVGGSFTTAGGKVSPFFARADLSIPFAFSTRNDFLGFSNQQFLLTLTGPPGSNAVISASTNLQIWSPLLTNVLTGGSLNFTDAFATNFSRRFYRAYLQ